MLLTTSIIKRLLIFACTTPLFIPQMVYADKLQTPAPNNLPVLPEVQVVAAPIAPTTGTVIIDKEMIDNLPSRNGSINEVIGIVPGIQYGETTFSSFTGGEITPPNVSISGSRFYDNNFTIDGVSNNSPLDPAFSSYRDTSKLPGYPQIHFLAPQLAEQITTYNSNIPAQFGGFTGGQVEVQTINPDDTFWGKINYRTTSNQWTKFHIDPLNEDEFYNSATANQQPKFKKHNIGFILNTPLTEQTGLLSSYQRLSSRIPLHNLDTTDTQARRRENFFIKLNHEFNSGDQISLTTLYTPTTGHFFSANTKDSNYTIESENYSLVLSWEKQLSFGQFKLNLSHTNQKTRRESPENRFKWSSLTSSTGWGDEKYSSEGGFGDLNTGQKRLGLTANISLNTLQVAQTKHQIKLGFEALHSDQFYNRPDTNYYYYSPRLDSTVVCAEDDLACINGEQYLVKRTKYSPADTGANDSNLVAFFQDSIIWKRLEVFPGIRISYSTFTDNLNIAPRFSTSLDIFGNRQTILFAGKNRYYSSTLLTHALYQEIVTINQTRADNSSEWENKSTPYLYQETSGVKTPYSDELTAGVIQKIFGGELKLQYLKKTSRDEFNRSKIDNPYPESDIYILKNDGRSEHQSLQLSWQRSWKNHFLEINGTWQETTTSNDDYSETLDEDDILETIWYKGEELSFYEIPRINFNRPFVANLTYIGQLPYGFTFTNITKYRAAYWKLKNTGSKEPSVVHPGEESYVYEKVKNKPSMLFDWKISWVVPQFSKQQAILSLDVYNVFNHRTGYNYQSGKYGYDYELGRQFWAGLEFIF